MAILPYRSPRPSLTKVWAILLQANYCWARRKRSAIYMCHGLHWCQVWVILLPTIFCGLGEKVQPFTCNMDCTCTKICRFGPYFWKPIIAGLGENDQPFICAMDYIGAKNLAKDFVVLCTGRNDYTVLETEELFEAISQALLSSVDCDFLRGWGRYVFIVWRMEEGKALELQHLCVPAAMIVMALSAGGGGDALSWLAVSVEAELELEWRQTVSVRVLQLLGVTLALGHDGIQGVAILSEPVRWLCGGGVWQVRRGSAVD